MPRPEWIFGFDCQEYAYAEFDKVMQALEGGAEYQPRNIPPDEIDHRTQDFRSDHGITHKGLAAPLAIEEQLSKAAEEGGFLKWKL